MSSLNHADCSQLNPGGKEEQLTNQLSWVAVWLLVRRICPFHLVYELVTVFYAPLWLG